MPSGKGLASEVEAWLETLAVESSQTLRQEPRSTIVPTQVRSTGGRKAMAMLEQLAGLAPGSSAQLKTGATIGEGGMGIIRLAEQTALGRTVAVKTLKGDKKDATAALDLLREAWVTGALEHPNIVPVHHVGLDDDGSPIIVLKRIEGVSWHDILEDADQVNAVFGAPDLLAWNLGILLQVLNAVRFAHSRGIIHRDLKPANVMVGEFGEVYLLDWGIALSLRDDGSGRLPLAKDADEMAGTPCYMAPEMLGRDGSPSLSERTDVYLAGAVLFEIITGAPPHTGKTALEVVTSVIASRPQLPDDAPPELARICVRAMAASPDDRFASIDEMRMAIAAYLEHRGSARLAELARGKKDELLARLALPAGSPGREREEIYRLYGACKFGFHEALSAWRDNVEARAGLTEATVAVAEHELAGTDPRAAVGLLSELDPPPADLLARARAAAAEHARRQEALDALQRDLDHKIGTRTRMFLVLILGVIFTFAPLAGGLRPDLIRTRTHVDHIVWSIGILGIISLLALWARDSMFKTAVNRRLMATAFFVFIAQIALWLGAWYLDVPKNKVQVFMILLWFTIDGMIAITIDRRVAVTHARLPHRVHRRGAVSEQRDVHDGRRQPLLHRECRVGVEAGPAALDPRGAARGRGGQVGPQVASQARMNRLALPLCLPIAIIGGCSGSGDGDDMGGVDAAPAIDAVPRSCTVVEDLGQLGARDGTPAASGTTGARILSVSMTVASDASTRDVVFVQLKGGKGAFAGRDPGPGTYALAGPELDYNTCGVCVTVIGDIVAGQGPTQFYFQRAGTVTITQARSSLVGALANMEFLELDIGTEELVRDGCETQVGGLTFDEALP